MLKTLVKIAEPVTAAACLAFVVLLFFQPDDPTEVQAAPAQAFPEEAAAAIDACQKARTEGQNANCPQQAGGEPGVTTTTAPADEGGGGVAGADVFADNCSSCHGQDGGGGIGPSLQDVDDVDLVISTVTNGRGSMPSFEGRLDEQEIEAVADYVTTEL